MLLRHFIGKRLAAYYAQSANSVVGGITEPLSLSSLAGRWQWLRLYQKLYNSTQGQWLTPVELFQPHYSRAIANYIIDTCDNHQNCQGDPFEIIELGGGRGTNARHVLEYLKTKRPDLYDRLAVYHMVDASPSLHEHQRSTLQSQAPKVRFVHQDLLRVAEGRRATASSLLRPSDDRLTILVALEVLDNLPHDKIRVLSRRKIDQAIVRQRTTPMPVVTRRSRGSFEGQLDSDAPRMEEVFVPLDDALIQRVLELCPAYQQEATYMWIPTVICGVLDQIRRVRPRLHLLLADFDGLPTPDTTLRPSSQCAYGEPLVTDMQDIDQPCYLSSHATLCDILFPTDFDKLGAVTETLLTQQDRDDVVAKATITTSVQKQAQFLQLYGPEHVAATKSWLTGFTPLLEDFGNCSVLTTTTKWNTAETMA